MGTMWFKLFKLKIVKKTSIYVSTIIFCLIRIVQDKEPS